MLPFNMLYLLGDFSSGNQSAGFFSCLHRLTNIQASNCGIHSVSRNAFRNLDHLTSLDLSDNYIRLWTSETLIGSASLVYLDLGNNYLSKLPSGFVKGLLKFNETPQHDQKCFFILLVKLLKRKILWS